MKLGPRRVVYDLGDMDAGRLRDAGRTPPNRLRREPCPAKRRGPGQRRLTGLRKASACLGLRFEFNSAPLEPQRRTYRGQGYDLVGQVPYVRRDGRLTSLLVWSSCCADCGAPFEFKTPASGGRFQPNRRCSAHERPGQRVKGDKRSLHIKETVEAGPCPLTSCASLCGARLRIFSAARSCRRGSSGRKRAVIFIRTREGYRPARLL